MTIGITGGIGSGKSTIARELEKRGYRVYDCDREAKRIIAENPDVQQEIIDLLGEEAFIHTPYTIHRTPIYNTAFVAKRVFEDKRLLEALNAIVHPAVFKDLKALKDLTDAADPVFVESAILYESGLDGMCDIIIVIDAPEDVRIARTIGRDYRGHCTEENINKVRARIKAQATHKGDWTISNDGRHSISALADEIIRCTRTPPYGKIKKYLIFIAKYLLIPNICCKFAAIFDK